MRSEVLGVTRILSLIADGAESAEIIKVQEEQEKFGQERSERGDSSEENVRNALLGLPIVSTVDRVPPNSIGDQNGVDIVVRLKPNLPEGLIGKIRVQVKSSGLGIAEFRQKIRSRYSLENDDEVNDWLIRNGWIILNDRLPQDEIAISFQAQLNRINDFARTEETVADRDDVNRRLKEQVKRFLDHSRSGTLTQEWREWGRRHSLDIARLVY